VDKPLSNIQKDNETDKKDAANHPPSAGGAYTPELSQKNWEESTKNLRWDATPTGRAIERVFTRGVLGAAAFAWGGWYASRGVSMAGYHADLKFAELLEHGKPLQYVAWAIDKTAGNLIKSTTKLFGSKDPERWVHFRPTYNPSVLANGRDGRSLGHEVVSITFDFFCASVADAAGRDIHDALDPHIKHVWKDDKGHIKPLETLKNVGKSIFRYVTYNGGEDWAVALPYVYYVRGQRRIIGNFSPRFKYDSDRVLNGGSFKIDGSGNAIGNYNMEGILDLQGRFTAYNIGTLMYREWYNHVDNLLHGKHTALYGDPDAQDKNHGITHDIGNLLKWTARSVVKGVITMTPVVPFFSIPRVSQSKYKGLFIDQNIENGGVLGYQRANGKNEMLHAYEPERLDGYFAKNNPPISKVRFNDGAWKVASAPLTNSPLSNPNFGAYKQTFGAFDKVLNAIGKAQNAVRERVKLLPQKWFGDRKYTPNQVGMSNYVNAAFAYTPYMYAKREAAILWDNGKMDEAAERMIDGVTDFNFKEAKAGAKEIWQAILHKPFDDPKREAKAQERIINDPSPSDGMTKANIEAIRKAEQNKQISWQERLVHAGRVDEAKTPHLKKHSSYADDVAMQKALRELQPPTNSVH